MNRTVKVLTTRLNDQESLIEQRIHEGIEVQSSRVERFLLAIEAKVEESRTQMDTRLAQDEKVLTRLERDRIDARNGEIPSEKAQKQHNIEVATLTERILTVEGSDPWKAVKDKVLGAIKDWQSTNNASLKLEDPKKESQLKHLAALDERIKKCEAKGETQGKEITTIQLDVADFKVKGRDPRFQTLENAHTKLNREMNAL